MNKFARSARNPRSIKIGGKAGSPPANQPVKPVAKAKPIPIRVAAASKPLQTRDGPVRRFYRVRDIAGPTGILPIGISTFWRWVGQGLLPKPIKFGSRCSMWEVKAMDEAVSTLEYRFSLK